jgi:hypothetical protein
VFEHVNIIFWSHPIAIALTLIAFFLYIRSIFSWIIWGCTTFIVFLAQLAAKGGVGAWAIGVSGGDIDNSGCVRICSKFQEGISKPFLSC